MWKRLDLDLSGSHRRVRDNIGRAVAETVAWAKANDASLVVEKLDFSRSRSELRDMPVDIARLLSGFAYRQILDNLASRCARMGVAVQRVDPAYTSTLGRVNISGVYGVSVDQAAATTIARRGLDLCEKVRPSVARAFPGCESLPRTEMLYFLHRRLRRVSRAATWDKGLGLCRTRDLPGCSSLPGSRGSPKDSD